MDCPLLPPHLLLPYSQGLDHVILVTALDRRLLLRQYSITFKRSGTTVPRVQLAEAGPLLDLSLRRSREAPADLASQALQRPKVAKKKVAAGSCHACLERYWGLTDAVSPTGVDHLSLRPSLLSTVPACQKEQGSAQ